ncbi:hypothetical protein ABW19_dt0204386 [Dactylella cylindrospora]|nr:hypothetical protein ABW19_dt0204386 [Dactylella cylindrospora]
MPPRTPRTKKIEGKVGGEAKSLFDPSEYKPLSPFNRELRPRPLPRAPHKTALCDESESQLQPPLSDSDDGELPPPTQPRNANQTKNPQKKLPAQAPRPTTPALRPLEHG